MNSLKKALCAATVIFASPMFVLAAPASAQEVNIESQTNEMESMQAKMMPYISVHETGAKVRFDVDRALADGVSEDIIRSGELLNEFSIGMEDDQSRFGEFPIWGNWCGKGYSGPGAPVDVLDTACMHHDQCYASRGFGDCSCDKELIEEISRNYWRMHGTEKATAAAISLYFKARDAVSC